jgi:hypothetical protein
VQVDCRRANEKPRCLFENAVFEAVVIRDDMATEARYCEPFDLLFSSQRFEYGDWLGRQDSNLESKASAVAARVEAERTCLGGPGE